MLDFLIVAVTIYLIGAGVFLLMLNDAVQHSSYDDYMASMLVVIVWPIVLLYGLYTNVKELVRSPLKNIGHRGDDKLDEKTKQKYEDRYIDTNGV